MLEVSKTFMKSVLFFILFFSVLSLFTGCSTFDRAGGIALGKGADANDSALVAAEDVMCRAASTGAIDRRYGYTGTLADARRTICDNSGNDRIVGK